MAHVIDTASGIAEVIDYWERSRNDWFSHDPEFDRDFRDRFADLYASARTGQLRQWESTAQGGLALLILLDQYPRNAFRGTARMYESDPTARRIARQMADRGFVLDLPKHLQLFCLLPFSHSEDLADQALAVRLHEELQPDGLRRARRHQAIIARFGRFPHRNAALGRHSQPEERLYLKTGGFQG